MTEAHDKRIQEQKVAQVKRNQSLFTDVRTAGFTQSSTTNSIDGVPINRKAARTHLSLVSNDKPLARRNRRFTRLINHKRVDAGARHMDKHANAKASGILAIRTFHKQAGLLLVPYTEAEMRQILITARDEFDVQGLLSVDTEMELNIAGYDPDQLTNMWSMMKTAQVNPTGIDQPTNSFGEGEETDV
jgi:hypothetical protein